MEKRKIVFGTYNTAAQGWTLTSWNLVDPQYKSDMVDVPGGDGEIDLSTVLTDGEPRYAGRPLTATFESSNGTRLEREAAINTMRNWLDGWSVNIELPDDPTHYITGRLHVAKLYNNMAHASVQVTATCQPWRYAVDETRVVLTAGEEEQTAALINQGRRSVVPLIEIQGGPVTLKFGTASWALGAGTYALPDITLKQGEAQLVYSGTGTVTLTYREAVL